MTNSRRKGKAGELELFKQLSQELGIPVKRNLIQSRGGKGDDCYDTSVGDFAIEVKRAETLLLDKWWQQTVEQANASGKRPMLVYRPSRHPWRVRVYGIDYVALWAFKRVIDPFPSDDQYHPYIPHDTVIEMDLPAGIRLIRLTLFEIDGVTK